MRRSHVLEFSFFFSAFLFYSNALPDAQVACAAPQPILPQTCMILHLEHEFVAAKHSECARRLHVANCCTFCQKNNNISVTNDFVKAAN